MDHPNVTGQAPSNQALPPPPPPQLSRSSASRQLSKPRLQKASSESNPSSGELLMWMNSNSANSNIISSPPPTGGRARTNSDYYGSPSFTTNKVYATRHTTLPPRPQRAKSSKTMRVAVGDEEQAEGMVIRELEDRRRRAMTSDGALHGEAWSAAVEGEQPPLGRQLPFKSMYNVYHDEHDDDEEQQRAAMNSSTGQIHASPRHPPRMADVAFKVRHAIQAGLLSPLDPPNRKTMLPPTHSSQAEAESNLNEHLQDTTSTISFQGPFPSYSNPPEPPTTDATSTFLVPNGMLREIQTAPPLERVLEDHDNRTNALTTDADRMVHGVLSIEQAFLEEPLTDEDEDDYDSSASNYLGNEINEDELLNAATPLLGSGATKEDAAKVKTAAADAALKRRRAKRRIWKAKWHRRWRSFFRRIGLPNSPTWKGFVNVILHSFAITLGVPSFLASIIVFYTLGTINLDFLPGEANLVWWLAFLARQCVTLDLARMSQWFLVDCVALRSRLAVLYLGPLITLWAIQSHGLPFLFTSWSLFNMLMLLGRNQFQLAWLFIFWEPPGLTKAMLDPEGQKLLASDFYFRMLCAMFVGGMATSAKRTTLAMYFGRKTLLNYRSRLEKLLEDMSIVEEVAQLAYEANTVAAEIAAVAAMGQEAARPFTLMKSNLMKRTISAASDGKWHSMTLPKQRSRPPRVEEDHPDDSDVSGEQDEVPESTVALTPTGQIGRESSHTSVSESQRSMILRSEELSLDMSFSDDFNQNLDGDDDADDDNDDGESDDDDNPSNNVLPRVESANGVDMTSVDDTPECDVDAKRFHRRTLTPMASSTASMSMSRIKNLLERWEEPVNKQDRSMDASIHDILKFRKALTYMDEAFPFSVAFGPASTRDECIKSSHRVYRRLLKLSNVPGVLSFEVLKVLSLSSDGEEDEGKTRKIRRLFRPDVRSELPLLAFVQSCDMVYKRLRFFRASVGNSSVIDKVLQDIIDVIYVFILSLLILSMLKFNPWPLLVSISTLMVSFAFAVGTSTSKLVEGILLIAARRPYDLGDRIVINNSEDVTNNGVAFSWVVEDINLFTTTLRYGATNEVATVSNGSIASSRIVNCQRSQNALITLELQFALDATEEKMCQYQAMIEQYIRERPRTWDGFGFFRCDGIDTGLQLKMYTLQARHNKTWQDAQHIFLSRSRLLKFCIETGYMMKVNYEIIHNQINYDGGRWEGPRLKSDRNLMSIGADA